MVLATNCIPQTNIESCCASYVVPGTADSKVSQITHHRGGSSYLRRWTSDLPAESRVKKDKMGRTLRDSVVSVVKE